MLEHVWRKRLSLLCHKPHVSSGYSITNKSHIGTLWNIVRLCLAIKPAVCSLLYSSKLSEYEVEIYPATIVEQIWYWTN